MNNREIAQKIYEKLLEKGAGIGNASIPIIEKVLDESSQFEPLVSPMLAEDEKLFLRTLLIGKISEYEGCFEDTDHLIKGTVKQFIDNMKKLKEKLK